MRKEHIELGKLRKLLEGFSDDTIVWLNDDINLSLFDGEMKPENFLAEIDIEEERVVKG